MNLKMGLVAVLIFFALVFVAQNIDVVTMKFLLWELSMSRAVLLFFALLVGFVIGWILHSYMAYRKNKKEVQNIKY